MTKYIDTDFLIIGGGPAGCMSAIRAKELNPNLDVTILEKAEISRSGAAGRGVDALNNIVVPGISTVDEYVEAMEIASDGILEPTISRVIGERSFGILKRLESMGLEFPKQKDGDYIVNQFHPKGRFQVEVRGEMKKILAKEVMKKGVRVINRHPVVSLMKQGDQIGGCIALNLSTSEPVAFLSSSVLLAAGGAARIGLPHTGYLHGTFDCPFCNGEAHKLGYDAGAMLTGFEYTAQSSMIRDYNGAGLSTFIRHGAMMINSMGERFMERYDPDLMEKAIAGVRMMAMLEEEKAGRGPISFTFSHLSQESIDLIKSAIFEVERPTLKDFFQKKGIDLKHHPVEVVMSEVYLCGGHGQAGLVGDAYGETSVPGLFAAGDCLANPIGFLPGAMCMGEAAAERIVEYDLPRLKTSESTFFLNKVKESIKQHKKGSLGASLYEFEYKFRRLVNEYIAPPKTEKKLQRFLDETEIMIEESRQLQAKDPHEFMKLCEVKSGFFCARMAARASMFRTESRFGLFHKRMDYPKKDDANWKTRVLIKKGPNGPLLETENKLKREVFHESFD